MGPSKFKQVHKLVRKAKALAEEWLLYMMIITITYWIFNSKDGPSDGEL